MANNPFNTANPFGTAAAPAPAAPAPASNPFASGGAPQSAAAAPASNPFSNNGSSQRVKPPRPSVTGLSWDGADNAGAAALAPAPTTLPPPEVVPDDFGGLR